MSRKHRDIWQLFLKWFWKAFDSLNCISLILRTYKNSYIYPRTYTSTLIYKEVKTIKITINKIAKMYLYGSKMSSVQHVASWFHLFLWHKNTWHCVLPLQLTYTKRNLTEITSNRTSTNYKYLTFPYNA